MSQFEQEITAGQRFEFGKNWSRYQNAITDERIRIAEESLQHMLGVSDLNGRTFIDIGSGSGLFSLAARRLGAKVFSFDYDPHSVATTRSTRQRFSVDDANWHVEHGSVLDPEYLKTLGQFDVVYSWGVLHHTGAMWPALENVAPLVAPQGRLFIALYNDQGMRSRFWWRVKKIYCSGSVGKAIMCAIFIPYFALRSLVKSFVTLENQWSTYKRNRGMSLWHDWIDWLGGYPFEVASVEAIKQFYEQRGFVLKKMDAVSGWGNNQFVFERL
jgi:2-polyprenyl-6-hydroxyphenyl methylase/3-demethylubiquinone-9 3-methyltransferase